MRLWRLWAISGLALGMGAGCDKPAPEPPTPAPKAAPAPTPMAENAKPDTPAPAVEKKAEEPALSRPERAKALEAMHKRGRFPWKELTRPENALIFLAMARDHDDPALVASALQGMSRTWAMGNNTKGRPLVDKHYLAVVTKRLDHADPRVLGRAIEAAALAMSVELPDEALLTRLAAIARDHKLPAARIEALEALQRLSDSHKNPTANAAMLDGLSDKHPAVLSTVLRLVQFGTHGLLQREAFETRARALMSHKDPGVRGRALLLATALVDKKGEGKETLGATVHGLLSDNHPYVRSTAASGVAALGRKASIHALMGMLGDKANNTYTLGGFEKLTGGMGELPHRGSAWFRVDGAVLTALAMLSADMGADRFEVGAVKPKTVEADLARAVGLARVWYTKHRGSLPPEGP